VKDGAVDGLKWTVRDIQSGFGKSICFESSGKPLQVDLTFDVQRSETNGGGKATPRSSRSSRNPIE
jgi:hypothetical protein